MNSLIQVSIEVVQKHIEFLWYVEYITAKVSDYQIDLRVKGQCPVYSKSVIWFVTWTPLSVLMECYIFGTGNDCQRGVDYNKCLDIRISR